MAKRERYYKPELELHRHTKDEYRPTLENAETHRGALVRQKMKLGMDKTLDGRNGGAYYQAGGKPNDTRNQLQPFTARGTEDADTGAIHSGGSCEADLQRIRGDIQDK